jgi:MYXO-CTERM domain-containing protein
MIPRPWHARSLGLLATAALAFPAQAFASPTLKVDGGTVTLGADAPPYFDTVLVTSTGILTAMPYVSGSSMSTGWLTLKANSITVDAGGSIAADGAGYRGQDSSFGGCALMTAMLCAGAGTMVGLPGGGGGFFAQGANGTQEAMMGMCTDLGAKAQGGAKFFDMTKMLLDLGSAGGAGKLTSATATAGGNGGGGIRLVAALVTINGTVSAAGSSANPIGGIGPGGGSGGAIEITTASLSGTGTLSVRGGDGAHGVGITGMFSPNNGGGGSGGVVILHLPPGDTSPLSVVSDGGKTGDCATFAAPGGGSANAPMAGACIDVDGDGHASKKCPSLPGDDCDDSDPNVHPGALELCNGKDDNCDGNVDEAPNECTMKMNGEVCGMVGGMPGCVAATDGGSDGGDVPQYIQLGGGCAMRDQPPSRGAAALGMGLLALAAAARRRRPLT